MNTMYMATIVFRVGDEKEEMYTTPLRSKNAGFLQPPGKAYSAGNLIRNGNTDPCRVSDFGEGRSSLPSACSSRISCIPGNDDLPFLVLYFSPGALSCTGAGLHIKLVTYIQRTDQFQRWVKGKDRHTPPLRSQNVRVPRAAALSLFIRAHVTRADLNLTPNLIQALTPTLSMQRPRVVVFGL